MIQISGLNKSLYGGGHRVDILNAIDLTIPSGQFVAITGASGSGKTTLAHIIAERTKAVFIGFSAVTEGVARVRKVITEAENRLKDILKQADTPTYRYHHAQVLVSLHRYDEAIRSLRQASP